MLIFFYIFVGLAAFALLSTHDGFLLVFTLISIFFLICLLLLVYNIHFLALSILIVYIGAVAVLFLFSVMLIGRTNLESKWDRFYLNSVLNFCVGCFIFYFLYHFMFLYSIRLTTSLEDNVLNLISSTKEDHIFYNSIYFENDRKLKFVPERFYATLDFSVNPTFVVNQDISFIIKTLKNENLLDIHSISSKLYEEYSVLFLLSGLILLISMLAVVGLLVPPRSYYITKN